MRRTSLKRLRMTAAGVDDVTNATTHADHLIPAKLERLLYQNDSSFVYGGRGSGENENDSITILTERARFRPDRFACFREIQQS